MSGLSAQHLEGRSNEGLAPHQALELDEKKAVMLSSAAAEQSGIVKGTTGVLGIQSVGHDLGLIMTLGFSSCRRDL